LLNVPLSLRLILVVYAYSTFDTQMKIMEKYFEQEHSFVSFVQELK